MIRALIFLSLLLLSNKVLSQANLKTAGELSGIVIADTAGFSIGYELAKTEAIFTYTTDSYEEGTFYLRMKDGSLKKINDKLDPATIDMDQVVDTVTISKFINSNFRLNSALEDNTGTFLSGGKFSPGIGLNYEIIYSRNQFVRNARYFFLRAGYEVKRNSFGTIDAVDTIRVDKRLSQSIGITPGVNIIWRGKKWNDNKIFAFSIPIRYNINPTDDLKTKDFIMDYTAGSNGVVQKAEKAWNGTQDDYFSITPKFDFAVTPWSQKNDKGVEIGSRFGFVGSISDNYNFNKNQHKWNFGIGPSIHPKWSTSQILATVQFEFLDFTDVTGEKGFDDIFSVKFYVGLPLYIK